MIQFSKALEILEGVKYTVKVQPVGNTRVLLMSVFFKYQDAVKEAKKQRETYDQVPGKYVVTVSDGKLCNEKY